jgi:NAD(P)-dependent dehydrogenase (short-subunit alcohol dehydrogenase family)
MARFSGKTAVITGGSSGIGLETARQLQAEGAKVVVTGRSEKALAKAREVLGPGALVVASDTAKLDDIDALVAQVKSVADQVDVLFLNAGVAKFMPFENVTESFFDEQHAVNAKGAYFTVQRFLPLLRSGSSVVVNTSVVDEKGYPLTSVYASSKAALRSIARTLAAELLPKGIRVNAVSPGPILTPIFDKLGLPAADLAGLQSQFRENNPMKRFGETAEVARAVLFLSAEATYTTGAEIPVDGGASQL